LSFFIQTVIAFYISTLLFSQQHLLALPPSRDNVLLFYVVSNTLAAIIFFTMLTFQKNSTSAFQLQRLSDFATRLREAQASFI